ncbi:DarT ssDNA thymidine ADP-ribosyltransferase family protein [Dactylosporangium sp. CA-092794]|uniref:DarT ssDNA thymidine ADP-ribosyltransferase family protein n=1 Tax=Dactylosporangium sp. CA-092794 TaxID=3239929 RepID=UPI003D8BE0A7
MSAGAAKTDKISAYVAERGITEVLHFTTGNGLLGIFATAAVRSRDRLDADKYIEHIYTPNCNDRLKDADWTDYVNLSISRVNGHMLGTSANKWHNDGETWWAVLAFDVSMLSDPGVYFTTTNNTYHGCVKRGTGIEGLRELFADSVEWGYHGSRKTRYRGLSAAWTTDPQAEVLYPGELSIKKLTAVYVRDGENLDHVNGLLGIFPNVPSVPVAVKPEVFQ